MFVSRFLPKGIKTHYLKKSIWGICTLLLLACIPSITHSATYIYDLNTAFSGTAPVGQAPWITAQFQDIGVNQVQLTVSTKPQSGGVGLTGSENIDKMYFNFAPTKTVTNLIFSSNLAPAGTTVNLGTNAFKADGVGGFFDILLNFPQGNPSGRFGANQLHSYVISGTNGNLIDASFFKFLSVGASGPGAPYYVAAHVQNTGAKGKDSGWIGANSYSSCTSNVPEPSTYVLIGSLLTMSLVLMKNKHLQIA